MSELICIAATLLLVVIFARVLLSYFPISSTSPMAGVSRLVNGATEWLLAPLRRMIPPLRVGGVAIDLSVIVPLIGLSIIRGITCGP